MAVCEFQAWNVSGLTVAAVIDCFRMRILDITMRIWAMVFFGGTWHTRPITAPLCVAYVAVLQPGMTSSARLQCASQGSSSIERQAMSQTIKDK